MANQQDDRRKIRRADTDNLRAAIQNCGAAIAEKELILNEVGKVTKGLNCLYALAELTAKYSDSLDRVFSALTRIIPQAWQYPEITSVRLTHKDASYQSANFRETAWRQSADIIVYGKKIGSIDVCLLEERPISSNGIFLNEERRLIDSIAERIATVIERKEMQEALIEAKRMVEDNYRKLQDLEGLKDSLTHMIVHDLNNPLTTIVGLLYLVRMQLEDKLTPEQKKSLDIASAAGDELKTMMGNLLDINKMEEGKIVLRPEEFDMAAVAGGVVTQMRVIAEHDRKRLSLNAAAALPKIRADKDLIKRVIANLINNALKYTPEDGAIDVNIGFDAGKSSFEIRVKDTGDGIPKEYLDKVFDKFVQVETNKKAKTGRGLGLTFCRMAVEAHGGGIHVESELGKGSAFVFTLPLKGCGK